VSPNHRTWLSAGSLRPRVCRHERRAVVLLAVAAVALPLTGCRTEPTPTTPPTERFAACLQNQGVKAIVHGEEVLVVASGYSISTGNAAAPGDSRTPKSGPKRTRQTAPSVGAVDVEAARAVCSRSVPDYRAPNRNQR
jgi:hypothetical protein